VSYPFEYCGPQTTLTVFAEVYDNQSAIKSVILTYVYKDQAGNEFKVTKEMITLEMPLYQFTINVGVEASDYLGGMDGTLLIDSIEAVDGAGNSGSAYYGGEIYVTYCPG